MELLTRTSEIKLVHGARRPFNNVQTHNWLSSQAIALAPSLPPSTDPQSSQAGPDRGAFAPHRQPTWKKRPRKRRRVSFQHAGTFYRRASRWASLSSRIHRSVTYVGLLMGVVVVGGHWPTRAAVGGISCSDECIPLTGHRPFYNLISKKNRLHWYFFFYYYYFRTLFFYKSSIVLKWQQTNFMSRSESRTELKPVLPFSLSRWRTCAATRAEDLQ